MKIRRLLMVSLVVLAAGIGLLVGYCDGTVSLGAAFPTPGPSLKINITTLGLPMLIGLPLTVLGMLLAVICFVSAVVAEIGWLRSRTGAKEQAEVSGARDGFSS